MTQYNNYLAYGTRVDSDVDLGEYLPEASVFGPGIKLRALSDTCTLPEGMVRLLGFEAHGRRLEVYSDHPVAEVIKGQFLKLEVVDVVTFYWSNGDLILYYTLEKEGDLELISFWFVHFVLPVMLATLRHFHFLHASSIALDNHLAVFTAPSTGGKSTLADYFLRQGHILVSDDKLAVLKKGDSFFAQPSHAGSRPYRAFEDLGKPTDNYSSEIFPIAAIFILQKAEDATEVCLTELRGFKTYDQLLPKYLYGFTVSIREQVEFLGKLIDSVPCFTIRFPDDLQCLPSIYTAVCEALRKVSMPVTAKSSSFNA